jgi:hypothetical protein
MKHLLVLIFFLIPVNGKGMNHQPEPPERERYPIYSVIQENKPLRHYPSLLIATYKVKESENQTHYITTVTDLEQAEESAFYEETTLDWYDAQRAHFQAWGWAIDAFPVLVEVSEVLILGDREEHSALSDIPEDP